MTRARTALATFALMALAAPALADPAYDAARNQRGILLHCQGLGHVGADAIAAQDKMLALMPAGDGASGGAAEAAGRDGVVIEGGTRSPIGDAAARHGATVAEFCADLGRVVKAMAAAL